MKKALGFSKTCTSERKCVESTKGACRRLQRLQETWATMREYAEHGYIAGMLDRGKELVNSGILTEEELHMLAYVTYYYKEECKL